MNEYGKWKKGMAREEEEESKKGRMAGFNH